MSSVIGTSKDQPGTVSIDRNMPELAGALLGRMMPLTQVLLTLSLFGGASAHSPQGQGFQGRRRLRLGTTPGQCFSSGGPKDPP